MIKTVIFDLGGVLVRTEDKGPRAALAAKYDMSYSDLSALVYGCESAEMATRGQKTAEEHKETVLYDLGLPPGTFPAFGKDFWAGDSLDRHLVDFIVGLKANYKTALLSNAWDDLREMLINQWKIDEIFDEIFISAELGEAKPDPEIFDIVIKSLGQNPAELIFIDDFPENIVAAREAGMNAVQFLNREQILEELGEYLNSDL